ncbi:MAG: hypothetical protein U0893_20610 [Chloroflexota bacterium]
MLYLSALLLTLAIEAPIVAYGLARWYRVRTALGIVLGLVASLVTHPVVWFVLPPLLVPWVGIFGYLLGAEAFAWLVEAAVFWLALRRDWPGLLLVSLCANLASFTVGAVLQMLGVW